MTKSQSPPERVAIVGSRETSKARAEAVREYIQTLPVGTIIVTGDCPSGVDNYVRSTAAYVGVELVVCHAAWDRYGKSAGPRRNAVIASIADRVVAFPTSAQSRGTWDCVQRFKDAGKPYAVKEVG